MTPLRSLFAALLLPLCATAAHAQDWKEIRFGVFPEYPPFESVAADGSLQGFDIELGNAICAKLEVKCTWVHNEFDGMIPALRARKFDAIMSSMAVTPAREKVIDFTDRLFLSPTSVITRKNATFGDTPESLNGKQVGVLQGSLQEAYARAHRPSSVHRSRRTSPRNRTTPTCKMAASTPPSRTSSKPSSTSCPSPKAPTSRPARPSRTRPCPWTSPWACARTTRHCVS